MERSERLKEVTILYVEDDELVRKGVVNFLRRRAKLVLEACNGKEGLELYRANMPNMVITDVEMPVMNGMEMIEEILKEKTKQPIIITTAYNDPEHTSDRICRNLIKPIDLKFLLESIYHCLRLNEECSASR